MPTAVTGELVGIYGKRDTKENSMGSCWHLKIMRELKSSPTKEA